MRLAFIGASHFGLRCLELAHKTLGCNVVGVLTAPQTFAISYRPEGVNNVLYADIASYAVDHGLPHITLMRSMTEPGLREAVMEWKPDLFLVSGWYHMVPKTWRDLAPAYGLHASLLPDYSGGAPLVWAMINGERKTGITLFQMDGGVDSGPIVAQAEEHIDAKDTIATLYARIEELGLKLLLDYLPKLINGSAILRAQSDVNRRILPQRSPEDGRIDWFASNTYLDRFVRAQTRPYPGSFSMLGHNRIIIWKAHSVPYVTNGLPPGSIFPYGDTVGVISGEGALILDEIQIDEIVLAGTGLVNTFRLGDHFATDRRSN